MVTESKITFFSGTTDEERVAARILEDEMFELLKSSEKSFQTLGDLLQGYFEPECVRPNSYENTQLCLGYERARLQIEMANDFVHSLTKRLRLLNKLAEGDVEGGNGSSD